MKADILETKLIRSSQEDIVYYLMNMELLKKEHICSECRNHCDLVKCSKMKDGLSWRCMTIECKKYKTYFSVRNDSFFYEFQCRSIIHYAGISKIFIWFWNEQNTNAFFRQNRLFSKIITQLTGLIPYPNFIEYKLGCPNKIVQIGEIMMSHNIKNHKDKAPENKTDAF